MQSNQSYDEEHRHKRNNEYTLISLSLKVNHFVKHEAMLMAELGLKGNEREWRFGG